MVIGFFELIILVIGFCVLALAVVFIVMGVMRKANEPKSYDHSEKWNDKKG